MPDLNIACSGASLLRFGDVRNPCGIEGDVTYGETAHDPLLVYFEAHGYQVVKLPVSASATHAATAETIPSAMLIASESVHPRKAATPCRITSIHLLSSALSTTIRNQRVILFVERSPQYHNMASNASTTDVVLAVALSTRGLSVMYSENGSQRMLQVA
jgi:hypothetical protein